MRTWEFKITVETDRFGDEFSEELEQTSVENATLLLKQTIKHALEDSLGNNDFAVDLLSFRHDGPMCNPRDPVDYLSPVIEAPDDK